jgi:hypothetical protein
VPLRAAEFLLLFFVGPAVFAYTRHKVPALVALWVLTACCLFVLLHDHRFDRRHFWGTAALAEQMWPILGLFTIALALGIFLV